MRIKWVRVLKFRIRIKTSANLLVSEPISVGKLAHIQDILGPWRIKLRGNLNKLKLRGKLRGN